MMLASVGGQCGKTKNQYHYQEFTHIHTIEKIGSMVSHCTEMYSCVDDSSYLLYGEKELPI